MAYNAYRLGWELRMSASDEAEILVFGQIVQRKWGWDEENNPDITAKEFDALLKDARAKGARKLKIRINSGGGSVFQAVAMRAMLIGAGFDSTEVVIEGLCASAATLLACVPGADVRIAEGAMYMIHNPMSGVWGTAASMEHEAQLLHKIEDDIRAIYAGRSSRSEDEIRTWMDEETWFTAKEAVENGFADGVIAGEGLAVACVGAEEMDAMQGMYNRMPEMRVRTDVSTGTGAVAAAEPTEIHMIDEEETDLEIGNITMEQLESGNAALFSAIMQRGAENERARVADIDALTPRGYEQMAADAKANGTTAEAFLRQLVSAQREQGANVLQQREQEVQAAAHVAGGEPGDGDPAAKDEAEMTAFTKQMSGMLQQMKRGGNGMY